MEGAHEAKVDGSDMANVAPVKVVAEGASKAPQVIILGESSALIEETVALFDT